MLHRFGDFVGVENDLGVHVASTATNRLNEAGCTAQKAFFVGIEDCDQRDFRDVDALTEQIHADDGVEALFAEFADDFDSFNRIEF